jgi:hypothetical protein
MSAVKGQVCTPQQTFPARQRKRRSAITFCTRGRPVWRGRRSPTRRTLGDLFLSLARASMRLFPGSNALLATPGCTGFYGFGRVPCRCRGRITGSGHRCFVDSTGGIEVVQTTSWRRVCVPDNKLRVLRVMRRCASSTIRVACQGDMNHGVNILPRFK